MNYPFQMPGFFGPAQDAALYFNSMGSVVNPYEYPFADTLYHPHPFAYPLYPSFSLSKPDPQADRPTDDPELASQLLKQEQLPFELKQEHHSEQSQSQQAVKHEPELLAMEREKVEKPERPQKEHRQPRQPKERKEESSFSASILEAAERRKRRVHVRVEGERKGERSVKKNVESNLINNVFSYICSGLKSQRRLWKLLRSPERSKIFYIFTANLKKLNGKYLNRKNIQALCEIAPNQPHAKMLSKSVKRLQRLPLVELRVLLRKAVFDYLRGDASLVPLLTSKKICKISMLQHLKKRRQLQEFMLSIRDYNPPVSD